MDKQNGAAQSVKQKHLFQDLELQVNIDDTMATENDDLELGNIGVANDDINLLLQEAADAIRKEEYTDAVRIYERLLDEDIHDVERRSEIFERRSFCLERKGEFVRGLKDAETALKLKKNITNQIRLGEALTKCRRYEEALEVFKEGLEMDPKNKIITQNLVEMQHFIFSSFKGKEKDSDMSYNPVEICSQDPYPEDREMIQIEAKILKQVAGESPEIEVKTQDVKESARRLALGQQMLLLGNHKKALEHFSMALAFNPNNDRCWGGRASVFYALKKYKEAYMDLVQIPKPNRTMDEWTLGGKVFYELGFLVHGELWCKKATQLSPTKNCEPAILFQQIRTQRVYSHSCKDLPIEVRFSEYGRAVYATDDIKAGTDIFKDLPIVWSPIIDSVKNPACVQCAKSLLTAADYFGDNYLKMSQSERRLVKDNWPEIDIVDCEKCYQEKYCSVKCQKEAWDTCHKVICPGVNRSSAALFDFNDRGETEEDGMWKSECSPMILARIWAQIIAEAKRLTDVKNLTAPTIEEWALAKVPFRRFIAYGITNFVPHIPKMVQVMRDMFGEWNGIKYPISDNEFNGRFYQAACNAQSFSDRDNPFKKFLNNLKNKMSQQTVGLLKYMKGDPNPAIFAGLFPLHSSLNHSCDNNVECYDDYIDGRPAIQVRAKKNIKAGDEILTSYIHVNQPRKERRAQLLRAFNFWCECPRCKFQGDDGMTCTHCHRDVGESEKNFPVCSRCHSAWYCSIGCQRQNWKDGHKEYCKPLVKPNNTNNDNPFYPTNTE
ncbi:unnamed protein product [Owenia fusiformis]|uniref:Uncharacterized protein n=1 Tax=Owenia fusiformis TaxID=6347 RepID=A0A8J1UNX4_OWEFU|nr:unnamed protein product [Owenia fusiformis]